MKLAIMQPYLFPYIGYYQLVDSVDRFVFLDDVNFIKRGYINRNSIANASGQKTRFTVPLSKASQNKLICDTYLHSSYGDWCKQFEKQLQHCYSKAPYYERTHELLMDIVESFDECSSIADLCRASVTKVSEALGIQTEFVITSSDVSKETSGSDRIIEICKHHKADTYHNAIGGKSLYSADDFKQHGIDLKFVSMDLSPSDRNYLSIIDFLMNHDPRQDQTTIRSYKLV